MNTTPNMNTNPQPYISTTHPPIDPELDLHEMMHGRGIGDFDFHRPPWELPDGTLDPNYKRINNVEED